MKKTLLAGAVVLATLLPGVVVAEETATATTLVAKNQEWTIDAVSPAAGEEILVVMHSAKDCGYCKAWKESATAGRSQFEPWLKSHAKVRFLTIERERIATPEVADNYPAEIAWLWDVKSHSTEKRATRPPVPAFEVIIGKTVLFKDFGTDGWEDAVFPKLKSLDGRRKS